MSFKNQYAVYLSKEYQNVEQVILPTTHVRALTLVHLITDEKNTSKVFDFVLPMYVENID